MAQTNKVYEDIVQTAALTEDEQLLILVDDTREMTPVWCKFRQGESGDEITAPVGEFDTTLDIIKEAPPSEVFDNQRLPVLSRFRQYDVVILIKTDRDEVDIFDGDFYQATASHLRQK